jgi:hypothetical protein
MLRATYDQISIEATASAAKSRELNPLYIHRSAQYWKAESQKPHFLGDTPKKYTPRYSHKAEFHHFHHMEPAGMNSLEDPMIIVTVW